MANRGRAVSPRRRDPPDTIVEPPPPEFDESDEAPPLRGKTHPPAEMGDAKPSLEDEVQVYHEHPNDHAATEFGVDPDAADAAADLAGDLGATFLMGATRGEDMSDVVMAMEDREENDLPFLIEEEPGEPGEQEAPARPRRRRAHPLGRL